MWLKLKEEKPEMGKEVICFNPEWINEDFNPNGTRMGFLNGDETFTTAYWWDYQDCYMTISADSVIGNDAFSLEIQEHTEPTHWMDIPEKPKL